MNIKGLVARVVDSAFTFPGLFIPTKEMMLVCRLPPQNNAHFTFYIGSDDYLFRHSTKLDFNAFSDSSPGEYSSIYFTHTKTRNHFGIGYESRNPTSYGRELVHLKSAMESAVNFQEDYEMVTPRLSSFIGSIAKIASGYPELMDPEEYTFLIRGMPGKQFWPGSQKPLSSYTFELSFGASSVDDPHENNAIGFMFRRQAPATLQVSVPLVRPGSRDPSGIESSLLDVVEDLRYRARAQDATFAHLDKLFEKHYLYERLETPFGRTGTGVRLLERVAVK